MTNRSLADSYPDHILDRHHKWHIFHIESDQEGDGMCGINNMDRTRKKKRAK